LEKELKNLLSPHNIHLGIIGFNPKTREYSFEPPLNEWEKAMRLKHKEYDYAEVSNLSYGPDINLSSDKWNEEDCIDIAEKLTYYSPYMVPFSFSSPFFDNKIWQGLSKRTFERTWRRPAVKAFTKENLSTLPTKKAKNVNEIGRIEFKSFDAILSKELLLALSSLTLGVALANLPGRLKAPDKAMHQLVAVEGFRNEKIYKKQKKF
jgi:hypothetical protein